MTTTGQEGHWTLGKLSAQGCLVPGKVPQGSAHGTNPARAQGAVEDRSSHGLVFGSPARS